MARRGKIACAAWAATLASACALLPLVENTEWLFQAALLLGLVSLAGVGARAAGLSSPLAACVQIVVAGGLLTVSTVAEFAVLGVVPGPVALEELGTLFQTGSQDVSSYASPAPLTEGIRLLLLCAVVGVGLLVDLLAVSLRTAAAAGLPLLAMYSAAAGISREGAGWPFFVIAATGFLGLLLTEGRSELAGWGRYFPGPATRQPTPNAGSAGVRAPRLRTGRRIGATALGVAVLVPLLLPSLGEGLLDPSGGGSGGAGSGDGGGSIAVNPVVALQDQLNQPDNRPVLTYTTTSEEPSEMYLRLVALDRFDGAEWTSSGEVTEEVPEAPWPVAGLGPDVAVTEATTRIHAEPDYSQRSLPVPAPAVDIAVSGTWGYDIVSRTLRSPASSQTTSGRSYEVQHLLVEPTHEQLAQAPPPVSRVIREDFTQVPDELPDVVRETALEITADARNAHERAMALQEWFTSDGGFRYDTDVDSGSGVDAISAFLEEREGFCVHFAFTMAAMARTLDIPAQVSVGFTPGAAQADGSFTVGLHNAHAWPELYFEGVGWTRFEPTPGQGSPPPYSSPEREESDPAAPDPERDEEHESPETGADDEERAERDEEPRCDPILEPAACEAITGGPREDDEAALAWPVVWGGVGALVALALALGPMLWRRRLRQRRLAPGAGGVAAWQELTDSAWDLGMPPDPARTPRQSARHIVRVGGLAPEGPAATAVHRLASAVEQELYAPPASAGSGPRAGGPGEAHADDVRTVRAALRAAVDSPTVRLRALLLPASSIRVMHRLGDLRTGFTERLRQALPARRRA